MLTTYLAVIATVIATLLIFNNALDGVSSPRWSKLLMPVTVSLAYLSHVRHWDFFSTSFMVGMLFVIVGDTLFAFDRDNKNFLPGLGAFAIAYTAIITAFVGGIGGMTRMVLTVAPTMYTFSYLLYSRGFSFSENAGMKIPAAVYTAIVTTMVVASAVTGNLLTVVGAFLAMFCDATIGLNNFGKYKVAYRDAFVFVPYNIGHLVLMLSLLPLFA